MHHHRPHDHHHDTVLFTTHAPASPGIDRLPELFSTSQPRIYPYARELGKKRGLLIVDGGVEGDAFCRLTMSFRPVNVPPSQAAARDNSASVPAYFHNRHEITSPESLGQPGSYPLQKQSSSNSDSQATILSSDSTESNSVFTPINGTVVHNGMVSSGQGSSQESQLLQLSQLAAAQEKMPDVASRSMKRHADGTLKDSETSPNVSPSRQSGHSRNVSGVSAMSTASSHVTEVRCP